jgi:hypothetical protein
MALDINPKVLGLPRLHTMAGLYEFYDIECELLYEPACGSGTAGQAVGYFDMDPEDGLDTGADARVKQAFGHAGVRTTNYWTPQHWVMPKKKGTFYVDMGEEERMVIKARFVLLSTIASAASSSVGIIYIRYRCRFSRSKLDSSSSQGGAYFSLSTFGGVGVIGTPTAAFPLGVGDTVYNRSPGSTLGVNTTPNTGYQQQNWYIATLSTTDSLIAPPNGWNGAFVIDVALSSASVATPTWASVGNCTAMSGEFMDVSSSSGAVFRTQYGVTMSGPSRNTGPTSSMQDFVKFHVATNTTPANIYVSVIAVAYMASLNAYRRIDARVTKLTRQIAELKQCLRLIESNDVKAIEDDPDGGDTPVQTTRTIEPTARATSSTDDLVMIERSERVEEKADGKKPGAAPLAPAGKRPRA